MSPTDKEVAGFARELRTFESSDDLGNGDFTLLEFAADALESLQSDLSAAREEVAGLEAALNRIVYLRPAGPTRNKIVEQMERIALEALRSSRTKGDPS